MLFLKKKPLVRLPPGIHVYIWSKRYIIQQTGTDITLNNRK